MDGIWVILSNDSSGELNREFVELPNGLDEDCIVQQTELKMAAEAMMADGIRPGDRIEFVEGWSER